jgi:DNA-binding PadR family transcriptional regulator
VSSAGSKPVTSSTYYVLLALSDADRHGVGIGDEVQRRTDGIVELGPGTLYATLSKMLDRGLIAQSDAPAGDDPRRRYYSITAAGREALQYETHRLSVVLDAAREKGIGE